MHILVLLIHRAQVDFWAMEREMENEMQSKKKVKKPEEKKRKWKKKRNTEISYVIIKMLYLKD